ncbi:MAG: 2-C-methyl-D-erythritol 2,4-cyclodiphosphate synthase [Verrucomicrobiota bacterium]|nr:2-C-methyl-D-erythritol 2,4-cyclodiphosphate synthase [Verrucomicrobiota bacterium]
MNKPPIRIGHGFDLHILADNRKLILGGVNIPFEQGLLGHSDADCVIHALSDALLGAAGLPDIGNLFPDDEPEYKNLDSSIILARVVREVYKTGYLCTNADITIIAQKPKLTEYIPQMKTQLSKILKIAPNLIGIKATTHEKIGALGRSEGIATHAVCLISKIPI